MKLLDEIISGLYINQREPLKRRFLKVGYFNYTQIINDFELDKSCVKPSVNQKNFASPLYSLPNIDSPEPAVEIHFPQVFYVPLIF